MDDKATQKQMLHALAASCVQRPGFRIRIRIGSVFNQASGSGSTLEILLRFKSIVLQFDSVYNADDISSQRFSLGNECWACNMILYHIHAKYM
jgi:hypothetical protein